MRARLRKFLTRQFGNPSGVLGKLIGNRMARGNVYDAQWTISLLDIQPYDRLLEIGFGPGVSTQLAVEKASKGFVAGVDHSQAMVQLASQRNDNAIRTGRLELKQGEVSSLPYPDQTFDVAYSLHSIYFWQNPANCLSEIRRALKPNGILAITIQPKDHWTQNIDASIMTLYFGKEIASLFSEAGFQKVHVIASPPEDRKFLECTLGAA